MSTKISYNLPGHGFSNCIVFDNASKLCELLDNHGIIEKSKNINQLGTMKYVYPGAHHTRYEYMFTQLMLISSVVTNKNTDEQRNTELSLGSYLKEFEANIRITGGDAMQCLAILSNSGFMFDTFTSDRILMRLLQESLAGDKSFYQMYRRNLPSEIHSSFDRYVQESNHYKLHLLHMIHLLEGMAAKQSDAPLCKFCISLLSKYVNPDLITHEATKRIIALYKKIRKIAYLSIDMIYTPAAVGVNLSRMIYTLPSYIVMCFVGGIKANGIKQTSNVDELDGLIYFPCRNDGVIAVIVEAKHYAGAGGGTIAKKQLDASIKHLANADEPQADRFESWQHFQ